MRPLGRLASLVRATTPLDALSRMRSASADAYQLIETAPAGSWERVAAWNAFIHQIYADNLMSAAGGASGLPSDTARIVVSLYQLAAGWLERAGELEANPARALQVDLRTQLPHWTTPVRSTDEVAGMRQTLDDTRIRVASDLAAFDGAPEARAALTARLAEIDAKVDQVALVWVSRASDEIRGAIGDALSLGLDRTSVLGQLLARPALLETART